MCPSEFKYGYRILGDCRNERRLVDAAVAFNAYAECDKRAETGKEAYLSAFQFGESFRSQLTMTGTTKGYRGPCWSPWLWWDIDCEGDLEAAAQDARKLAASLAARYGIDGDDLLLFFSGSKGFHIGLPTSLFAPEPSVAFNKIARRFAENAAARVGIAIDTGVYDKVRAFRAPNSKHPKTGLHKLQLEYEELLHWKIEKILENAKEPLSFPPPCEPPPLHPLAVSDWAEAVEQLNTQAVAITTRKQQAGGANTLNRSTLEFVRDGATTGDRHRLLFSAAANLAEFNCTIELALALLTESALDSGLPPSEVRRQIRCGLEHARSETVAQGGPCVAIATQPDPKDPDGKKRDSGNSVAPKWGFRTNSQQATEKGGTE